MESSGEQVARDGRLINEAIKRILLDMLIRGHGDRLIGRWSREREIQKFLAQVPYLLDRISQLHLACSRTGSLLPAHAHHFHHRRRHQSREQELGALRDVVELLERSGAPWLVRTRDALGLTPIHKSVLAENGRLLEFLLQRYKDEPCGPGVRLLDAQDKYGRSALHYAAALAATGKNHERVQLYKLLLSHGASSKLQDFRGKTPRDYALAAPALRVRTIIHLANRMNANFQANVLSRTLRSLQYDLHGTELPAGQLVDAEDAEESEILNDVFQLTDHGADDSNFKSRSCANLLLLNKNHSKDLSSKSQLVDEVRGRSRSMLLGRSSVETPPITGSATPSSRCISPLAYSSPSSSSPIRSPTGELSKADEGARKELIGHRSTRLVMDQQARQTISRALKEGILERCGELLLEGYGSFMTQEAGVTCWNQQCRRYLLNVVPSLLRQLDDLHESIALNRLDQVKLRLREEPLLVRIRRPYKQAAMSAIHVAAQFARRSLVVHLLARFPELLEQCDSLGATCLHWAARASQTAEGLALYEWLLHHFGYQLEAVKDSRGRRAHHYREQVVQTEKLNYSPSQPKLSSKAPDASDLIKRNQEASNKLKLIGTRCPIDSRSKFSRFQKAKSTPVPGKEPESSQTELTKSDQVSNQLIDPSESGKKSSGSSSPQNEELVLSDLPESPKVNSEQLVESGDSQKKLSEQSSEMRIEMLAGMTQLDCDDVSSMSNSSTSKLEVQKQSSRRLEVLMAESIKQNDLTSLERLILAGFGRRIIHQVAKINSSSLMSEEVRDYLTRRAPELTNLIEKIHKLIHVCYSHPEHHSVQANFHKLSNLLTCNSLVMSRDRFGATPLHVALLRADKRLAEYLLRRQPEAASAPDHLNRTPLHYAALTLATFREHKVPFRLVSETQCEEDSVKQEAFWLVDKSTQVLYDNLCVRYGELLEVLDSRGFTCKDYLKRESSFEQHQSLKNFRGSKLIKAGEAFESCCPEYARLLDKYNYRLMMEESEAEPLTVEKLEVNLDARPHTADELHKPLDQVPYEGQHDDAIDLPVAENLRIVNSAPAHDEVVPGKLHRHHHKKHGHHHHHHHHHHRRQSERTSPRDELSQQSLVGGVIVPTIIHNDKLGEIETYDIIYRQPANSRAGGTGSNSVKSTLNLSSSSSSSCASLTHEAQSSESKLLEKENNKEVSTGVIRRSSSIGNCSSSSNSSSRSSSIELDDERVERLSLEFENRVRREKCELRQKVDQIMSEIKLSAKSEKSTRLLNSPAPVKTVEKTSKDSESLKKKSSKGSSGGSSVISKVSSNNNVRYLETNQQLSDSNLKVGSPNLHLSSKQSISLSGSSVSTRSSRTSASATSAGSCGTQRSGSSSRSSYSSASNLSTKGNGTRTGTPSRANSPLEACEAGAVEVPNPSSKSEQQGSFLPAVPSPGEAGVNHPAIKNAYGQTYLHFIASRTQSASALYKVLDHARYLIGERDIFYRSARDVAVQFNLANNVQVLDKFIIDLFIGSNTPLLKHLLNQGYSPLIHVADPDGNDIMLILKLLKLDRMVHFLLLMADFQRWRDELHTFIRHGYSAGVKELIRKHKDLVRAKSLQSRNSLHLAILFDRLDMIAELLSEDPSSVHSTDNMGRTPLHYAYGLAHLNNSESIREQLLAAGASLEARDVKMRTPKYYFIFKREIEDIKRVELELN